VTIKRQKIVNNNGKYGNKEISTEKITIKEEGRIRKIINDFV